MPLAIDASLRYGLGVQGTRPLKQSHLRSSTPYNTHRFKGLPPTPITNPGLPSMRAAAKPANVDYLYYVRKPNSVRHFFTADEARVLREGRGVRLPGLLALRCCSELREDVGHLEAGAHGFGALVQPVVRLLCLLEREQAEGDRNAGLERRKLEPRRGLAGDEVEVRRVAADHAAERDDARVAACLRQRHGRDRQLERARHRHDR